MAQETIKIGVLSPFTGGSSPMGLSMRDGVRLAASEINAQGGVLGRKLELVERDDQAVNERGSQMMQEMINNQRVVAVLGPTNAGVARAAYRYPQEAKIPMLINVSAGAPVNELFPEFPDNYVFRIAASDILQAEMIVHEAVDVRGLKRVALLCDDTNYGQNGREKMEEALKRRNMTAVYVGKFKIRDTDMTPQLQEARRAGAEALLSYGIGPELAQIANGRQRIGWPVPMIGSWTLSMSNFIDNALEAGNGATMPQTFIQSNPYLTAAQKQFIEKYQKQFRVERIPVAVAAAQGYDSLYLLAAAITRAGSTEGPKVKAALETLPEFTGVLGTFRQPFVAGKDHEAIEKEHVVMGVVKDGIVVAPVRK